jgi:hypothetical protein
LHPVHRHFSINSLIEIAYYIFNRNLIIERTIARESEMMENVQPCHLLLFESSHKFKRKPIVDRRRPLSVRESQLSGLPSDDCSRMAVKIDSCVGAGSLGVMRRALFEERRFYQKASGDGISVNSRELWISRMNCLRAKLSQSEAGGAMTTVKKVACAAADIWACLRA